MSGKLKMIFVLIAISVTGCATISGELSLPPIDFCSTYPQDGIPTIKGSGNMDAKLFVDQLNAVYLEKCLGIDMDEIAIEMNNIIVGDIYGKENLNRRGLNQDI